LTRRVSYLRCGKWKMRQGFEWIQADMLAPSLAPALHTQLQAPGAKVFQVLLLF
jgi:hypothetical protein